MATGSFFEDMVIDTAEAAADPNAIVESGIGWKRGDTAITFASPDNEMFKRIAGSTASRCDPSGSWWHR